MANRAMILTEDEWIKVIQLVDNKSGGLESQNEFDDIKTKMLFQYGMFNVKDDKDKK